ncbi:hypothetical protein [Humibacillus sp. DSM 29435]|uniref:hypothetical protein n=1 Tax=Humibacillus sp. DSM 29435 TaxID=1869167 RepID=UPI001C30C644|nr:hypothetical protein [Humibacillus sp. DSM 29435]
MGDVDRCAPFRAVRRARGRGRDAFPEEIAAAFLFLRSNVSDMINGADPLVDGGHAIR